MPRGSSILLHQALVAAAIIIPAAAFVAAALENRSQVLGEARDNVSRTAAIFDEHARKVFETVDLLLGRVNDRLHHHEPTGEAAARFLQELKAPLPQAASLWIIDAEGRVEAGSTSWNRTESAGDRPPFQLHKTGSRQIEISAPFYGRVANRTLFAVTRARTGPDDSFRGVIEVALSPDYFSGVFRTASRRGNHVAMLLRSDGSVLASDPGRLLGATLGAGSSLMHAIALQPEGGVFSGPSPVDGEPGFYAFRRASPYDVYVVFGQSQQALLGRWHRNLRHYGAVTVSASIFLLALSLLALRRVRAEHDALRELAIQSEQRIAAEQRLAQSQKMESLGQLTGGIAHDFNNLLSVVLGNLSLLGKHVRGNARAEALLQRAMLGAERGATLTQRLLAFARRQDLAPRSVDISGLMRSMGDLLRSTLGANIEVAAEIAEKLPPAFVDPNQLELAILNLAVNARDAMPDGGRITISVAAHELQGGNELGLAPGHYLCVALVDTGAGMDEATLARATEPFFTTKEVGKGTGLGLSMVHGLAIQSGGSFRLLSHLGHGTRAEIWLPRASGREAERAASGDPNSVSASKASRGRVLLVDDDELVRASIAAILEEDGYEVTQASDAASGLALAQAHEFDLVITDVVMPGMSGSVLASVIGQAKPGLTILVTTGHAERAGEVPADVPRLKKPFTAAELSNAVSRLLAQAPVEA